MDWETMLSDNTSYGAGDSLTLSSGGGWTTEEPAPFSYERFRSIVSEEMDLLPQYVFDELTGGVLVEKKSRLSPDSVADDLFILGLYTWSGLGKQVTLFYGSFLEVIGKAGEEVYRARIRETLRHEFLHHMETQAGMFGKGSLLEEDERRRQRYLQARRGQEKGEENR